MHVTTFHRPRLSNFCLSVPWSLVCVDRDAEAGWHLGRFIGVAGWVRHAGAAAGTDARTIGPRALWMRLADPAGVVADLALEGGHVGLSHAALNAPLASRPRATTHAE